MNEVLLINPRKRKRRRARTRARRNPLAANPRKRSRRRRRASTARVYRYRRNPRTGLADTLMPIGAGIGGALAAEIALGLVPLPAALQTPMFRPLLKAGAVFGLSFLAGQFVSKSFARKMLPVAIAAVVYDTAKGFVRQAVPTLPLGDLTQDFPLMDYRDPRLMDQNAGAQFYDDGMSELIDVPSSMGELFEDETY